MPVIVGIMNHFVALFTIFALQYSFTANGSVNNEIVRPHLFVATLNDELLTTASSENPRLPSVAVVEVPVLQSLVEETDDRVQSAVQPDADGVVGMVIPVNAVASLTKEDLPESVEDNVVIIETPVYPIHAKLQPRLQQTRLLHNRAPAVPLEPDVQPYIDEVSSVATSPENKQIVLPKVDLPDQPQRALNENTSFFVRKLLSVPRNVVSFLRLHTARGLKSSKQANAATATEHGNSRLATSSFRFPTSVTLNGDVNNDGTNREAGLYVDPPNAVARNTKMFFDVTPAASSGSVAPATGVVSSPMPLSSGGRPTPTNRLGASAPGAPGDGRATVGRLGGPSGPSERMNFPPPQNTTAAPLGAPAPLGAAAPFGATTPVKVVAPLGAAAPLKGAAPTPGASPKSVGTLQSVAANSMHRGA